MEKETRIFYVNDFYELKNNSWSGALDRLEIIEKEGKEQEFLNLINDLLSSYENGVTDTQLNDFIWFEEDYYFDILGIKGAK